MQADRVRDARIDRVAWLLTAYHALADLHLRHDQIARRRIAPRGWQEGIAEAMEVLQEVLEVELAAAREAAAERG